MSNKPQYTFITSINALRFFAAISIVIFHFGRWSFPFNIPSIESYVLLSNTAVTLFFVLSGFIMVHVYGERLSYTIKWDKWKHFFKARIARIIPIYILALAATIIYFLYLGETVTLRSILLQLTFLQAWIPNQSLLVNFAGWSLSVEMFFYLLFPALILWLSNITFKQRIWIASIFWFVSNIITFFVFFQYVPTEELSNIFLKFFPLLHLNSFIIGIIAGMWFQENKKIHTMWYIFASLILFLNPIFIGNEYNPVQHNGLLAPLFAILIIGIARSKHIVAKVLSFKPLVEGGDAAYGIYIFQAPVYWWTYEMYNILELNNILSNSVKFFIYLAILICISIISRYTIEKWAKHSILNI